MKISVCGKGGSGKSTIVALLANEALKRDYDVLVVDSDESNTELYSMLGFTHQPNPLMELVGGKQILKQKMAQPNIFDDEQISTENIPEQYVEKRDNLKLVAVGKILQSLEGCACPMNVLSREFLKKLAPKNSELAFVDMEAGVEHFGRGVETSIDNVLIVVEPPLESINVAQKICELASEMGIKSISAVLNKMPSVVIEEKIKTELKKRQIEVIGCIHYDPELFNASIEGVIPESCLASEEIKGVLNKVLSL